MEKKNVVPVWVSVMLLVLSIAGIVNAFVCAIELLAETDFSLSVIFCVLTAVAALLAVFYCLLGYKKSAARVLQAYGIAMTLERMISLYLISQSFSGYAFNTAIQFFATLIQCGIWFVLTIAKDLGRKKTLVLVGLLFALALVLVATAFLCYDASFALETLPGLIYYIVTFIMFYAKYQDKAARGTK